MQLLRILVLAFSLAAWGCGESSEPPQPKLTEDQVKDLMKDGENNAKKERGNRRPGT